MSKNYTSRDYTIGIYTQNSIGIRDSNGRMNNPSKHDNSYTNTEWQRPVFPLTTKDYPIAQFTSPNGIAVEDVISLSKTSRSSLHLHNNDTNYKSYQNVITSGAGTKVAYFTATVNNPANDYKCTVAVDVNYNSWALMNGDGIIESSSSAKKTMCEEIPGRFVKCTC